MRALYAHMRSKNSAGGFHYHVWCALAERIANRACEGTAGEGLAGRPHARRVAAVVELLAQVDTPVLVVGDDALWLE